MPAAFNVPATGVLPYEYVIVPTHFQHDTWVRFAILAFLAGYGPGNMPELLAPRHAKLIKAGSDLVFQLHYTPNGTLGCDRSRIGLILSHEPPCQRVLMLAAANIRFLWQLSYYLAKPLPLPPGTTIECTAHFDNSAANPMNPDPIKAVRFGPPNFDEMMIGYFDVATDLKNDLRALLLPSQANPAAPSL